MDSIIGSQMEVWGMVDHGLKKAVPFLYILLFCFIPGTICDLLSLIPDKISIIFFLISIIISGIQGYTYYKLSSYNNCFLTITALTVANIFARLFIKLLNALDFGIIGMLLSIAALAVQFGSSILCYKISFDANGDLVSPVDPFLESRWKRIWPLTIFLYITALVVSLFSLSSVGITGFSIGILGVTAILNIIIFTLMIFTIRVCKND